MECKDCPYFWDDSEYPNGNPEEYPRCHYRWNDGEAPCEVEEKESEDLEW